MPSTQLQTVSYLARVESGSVVVLDVLQAALVAAEHPMRRTRRRRRPGCCLFDTLSDCDGTTRPCHAYAAI